jgi:4a-hydroxytetrahydrobiopterin dehydratase
MAAKKLSEQEIQAALARHPDWSIVKGKLHRELQFRDFVAAFAFITQVALIAEALGHHPEWFNVYNRLVLDLTTHDVDGLSDLDLEFATRVDALLPV